MIDIQNLRYRTLAIDSLSLDAGITSIIGRNGSGKTTLLKLCAGIILPGAGTILIDGTVPRQAGIGWVNEYPDRNLLFDSVADEIASPLRFRHAPPREIGERTGAVLERFGLAGMADRAVRDLSGGEKVLVAVAAAMITDPQVLILDECDSHLDARSLMTVDRIIRSAGIPYVLRSTQDMETAAAGDRVVFLKNGQVGVSGTPEAAFAGLAGTSFYPLSWRCRV